MANGITSEWEDIHVKLGNYVARPYEKPQSEYTAEAIDKLGNYNPLEKKTMEQLEEMEDDLDEGIFEEYRRKKLAEMEEKSQVSVPLYGRVTEISREDYISQVTNADPSSFVLLHLYQNSIEKCRLINEIMENLSSKHSALKFMKIVSTRCIENFPDTKLPCLIIYKGGKMLHNITNLDAELRKNNVKGFEAFLKKIGVLEKPVDFEEQEIENLKSFGGIKGERKEDADESDEDEGKEYIWRKQKYMY